MDDNDERTQLTADEQIRLATLAVASARYPNADLRTVTGIADALGEWVLMGELPKPPPGITY